MTGKIEQMVDQLKSEKAQQKVNDQHLQKLATKLQDKAHESGIMKHSLMAVLDQLSFTEKDNSKFKEEKESLLKD
jgi:hypothetical protein